MYIWVSIRRSFLTFFQQKNFKDCSKLKEFADNSLKFDKNDKVLQKGR